MARLFGERATGAVAIVEPPVSRSYVRKARVAFYAAALSAGLLTAAAVSTEAPVPAALLVGVLAGVSAGVVVAVLVRVWPVLRALWHWAGEIAAAVAAVMVAGWLVRHLLSVVLVVVAVALPMAAIRPMRHRATRLVRRVWRGSVAWVWCAVVRHRLRLCFAEFLRSANRVHPGSLPLILLARPTPAGERVWVWLRPGLDLSDLDGKTGKVAVACWAGEVRVVRASARFAALVRVDITRRDPLTDRVSSPLPRLVPASTGPALVPAVASSALALDLPDVPEEVPESRPVGRR